MLSNIIRQLPRNLIAFAIILCVYQIGVYITSFIPFAFPAPVTGMLLMFMLLQCGFIKIEWVDHLSTFTLKHLIFFFIPSATGLVEYTDLFFSSIFQILLIITLGIILIVLGVGKLFQGLNKC